MAVKPGDILRDKYRIDALIGRGGMGQVFAATALDSSMREQVAIKVVSRLLVDDVLMIRLHREAEAATRIRSDFVPRVVEVSDTEEGETFLVMERLVGEPLSQRIRDNGALPWSEVSRIGEDVLRALIDAHTAGVVHRDLKPSNVFLALKAGRVRAMVLDFGVCKLDGVDAERLTGTGESIGTVAYMAPEQIRGAARVDERADLYGFGVMVFEMLCGRLPHDGPSQMAILASKLENHAARLNDWSRVSTPDGTDALVTRALARDPQDRFGSAQELLKAWRGLSKTDTMIAAGSVPPPRPSDDEMTAGGDAPTEVSRPPPPIARGHGSNPEVTPASAALPLSSDSSLANVQRASYAVYPPPSIDPLHPGQAIELPLTPLEPHPTQTALASLTTSMASRPRSLPSGGGARIALVLAAASLLVGVGIVGVTVSRQDARPRVRVQSAGPGGEGMPGEATSAALDAPADPQGAFGEEEGAPPDPEPAPQSFELPSSSEPSVPKPRPVVRFRPRPTAPAPAKSSGPRITSQPRY